jgi:putative hemolysin
MEIALLIALIVLNGVFAMSEIALVTARRARLARLAEDGDGSAAVAMKLGEDPTRFLSTIQIGITSIGILNGIVGEAALAGPLAEWLQTLGMEQRTSEIGSTCWSSWSSPTYLS